MGAAYACYGSGRCRIRTENHAEGFNRFADGAGTPVRNTFRTPSKTCSQADAQIGRPPDTNLATEILTTRRGQNGA
jgi:hypothetical protein